MEDRLPRKLVAIFYADVAGYSRLTGADEEGTHRRLSEYLDFMSGNIGTHQGKVVHYAGDAVLAEFNTVTEALTSASAIQRDLAHRNKDLPDERKVEFRIGVNLGEVIVDRDDIYGDGVNVAARLEALADPGGICISDAVRTAVGKKLDLTYEDMGEQQVKNIEEPVRAYKVMMAAEDEPKAKEAVKPGLKLSGKPSIAVLPFNNMSGDMDQEYFSDGITEDIITELSRFPTLFVIARHSTFSFKGQPIEIEEVGRKLGVKYVVEGSVRKAGIRVRITAQLIDTSTSNHVWAERYDRELEDIFAVQDEVTRSIVSSLSNRLEAADAEHAKHKATSNMSAYDYLLQGREHWHRLTREDISAARSMYRKAVDLDPQYARAHTLLAATHIWDKFMGWSVSSEGLREARTFAEKALALDERDGSSHAMLGFVCFFDARDDKAEAHFERALSLNPNDADVAAFWSDVLVYLGRTEEALSFISRAKQLNPFPPDWYHWFFALVLFSARRYEDAIRAIDQIHILDRWHHAYRAGCFARLGRAEEAQSDVQAFVTVREKELTALGKPLPVNQPDLVQERAGRYREEVDRDHFLDSLRVAGLLA
jgi:adenylate cyclase